MAGGQLHAAAAAAAAASALLSVCCAALPASLAAATGWQWAAASGLPRANTGRACRRPVDFARRSPGRPSSC